MRATRAKYIRRILRQDYPGDVTTSRYISHPKVLDTVMKEKFVRYSFQYVNEGFKRVVGIAKRIYKKHGMLPR